jgi:hypothetical protein
MATESATIDVSVEGFTPEILLAVDDKALYMLIRGMEASIKQDTSNFDQCFDEKRLKERLERAQRVLEQMMGH